MKKEEFMTRLEQSLQDISYEERQNALRYYEEYFEDAGESDEEAIEQLESPEDIANTIKDDLDIKLQLVRSSIKEENKENKENSQPVDVEENQRMETWKIVLIVVACIVFSPMIFGGAGGVLGIVMAIIGTACAFTVAAGALIFSGIILVIAGIVTMFGSPILGLLVLGTGIFLMGLGCLFGFVITWFWTWAVPTFVKWIRSLIRKDKIEQREASL